LLMSELLLLAASWPDRRLEPTRHRR